VAEWSGPEQGVVVAAGPSNIKARRRLQELRAKGVEVRLGATEEESAIGPFVDSDGQPIPCPDDKIAVWVQPPSPLQRDQALRDAQAARARAILKTKRDDTSEEQLTSLAFLAEMSLPTLIEYLIAHNEDDTRTEAIRDVLQAPEWKDMTELQDAMRQFEEADTAEDDPEWAPLLARDAEYGRQINNRIEELDGASRESFALLGRDELERRALAKRSDLVGSQSFMNEYERQMTWYAVRDIDDHGSLFFESAREFADQEDDVRQILGRALTQFIQDGTEAKNLLGAESSSDSSAPPSEPETSDSSTPEELSV
jgi:hypothetical protein